MNPTQAKRLGALLRKKRQAKGWTTRQLEAESGVQFSTIIRLEQGHFMAPAPDKLARLAQALDIELATVLELADYDVLNQPPSPKVYLRTKYRNLSQRQLSAVTRDVEAVLKRHGVESTEQSSLTTKRTNSKKGGKS
jgi:transcriptional regulator with XRE-family HTH domain